MNSVAETLFVWCVFRGRPLGNSSSITISSKQRDVVFALHSAFKDLIHACLLCRCCSSACEEKTILCSIFSPHHPIQPKIEDGHTLFAMIVTSRCRAAATRTHSTREVLSLRRETAIRIGGPLNGVTPWSRASPQYSQKTPSGCNLGAQPDPRLLGLSWRPRLTKEADAFCFSSSSSSDSSWVATAEREYTTTDTDDCEKSFAENVGLWFFRNTVSCERKQLPC